MTRTCVVADDHPVILAFLRRYLEEHEIRVAATASTAAGALAEIGAHKPDVAILDLFMTDGGVDVEAARRSSPATKILIYTAAVNRSDVQCAIDVGADGVISKEAPLWDLLRAIDTTCAGGAYLDAAYLERTPTGPELTPRQLEVLELVADGLAQAEIAARLGISGETVRCHVRASIDRTGGQTKAGAVAAAIRMKQLA